MYEVIRRTNIYNSNQEIYEQYWKIKLMTMGLEASQNLYNVSLGCEVLESCPVFKIDDHRKMWYLSLSSSGSGDRNGQRIEWGE